MHGRYRSPIRRSKLPHHAVCIDRPIIVRLMNCCHATLAIILLSPSVSATVHSAEIIYLSFLLYEIHLIIDRGPHGLNINKIKINK